MSKSHTPSPHRQTLLFSATLPKLLVEFAKAGLRDPVLVRLDVDSKLSTQLKMTFLAVRSEVKSAVLLHLLGSVITGDQQTVVFAPTRHHVEYLKEVQNHKLTYIHSLILSFPQLMSSAGMAVTYVYSSLDQTGTYIPCCDHAHVQVNLQITDTLGRIILSIIERLSSFRGKMYCHLIGWCIRKCPLNFIRGSTVSNLPWLTQCTVEPLIKDTLNKGHRCIKDTF